MPPNKGKQGTKGQKQIVEENKDTLNFYFYVITAINVLYFGTSLIFFRDAFTFGLIVLLLMSSSTYLGCYYFMKYMTKATYSETGALLDGGTDLNMDQGLAEHIKDLILITGITQSLSLISSYFWLLLLSTPARAFYLLWVNILGPWFFAEAPEVDEKKQKKMERKMKRR